MDEAFQRVNLTTVLYVFYCFPHSVAFSVFMFCYAGYVCVLYVGLGSSVTPNIFGCVIKGSIVLSTVDVVWCYIL